MLWTGVVILQALSVLSEQTRYEYLSPIIKRLYEAQDYNTDVENTPQITFDRPDYGEEIEPPDHGPPTSYLYITHEAGRPGERDCVKCLTQSFRSPGFDPCDCLPCSVKMTSTNLSVSGDLFRYYQQFTCDAPKTTRNDLPENLKQLRNEKSRYVKFVEEYLEKQPEKSKQSQEVVPTAQSYDGDEEGRTRNYKIEIKMENGDNLGPTLQPQLGILFRNLGDDTEREREMPPRKPAQKRVRKVLLSPGETRRSVKVDGGDVPQGNAGRGVSSAPSPELNRHLVKQNVRRVLNEILSKMDTINKPSETRKISDVPSDVPTRRTGSISKAKEGKKRNGLGKYRNPYQRPTYQVVKTKDKRKDVERMGNAAHGDGGHKTKHSSTSGRPQKRKSNNRANHMASGQKETEKKEKVKKPKRRRKNVLKNVVGGGKRASKKVRRGPAVRDRRIHDYDDGYKHHEKTISMMKYNPIKWETYDDNQEHQTQESGDSEGDQGPNGEGTTIAGGAAVAEGNVAITGGITIGGGGTAISGGLAIGGKGEDTDSEGKTKDGTEGGPGPAGEQGPDGEDNDSEEEPDDENEDTQGTVAEANDSEEEPDDGNEDTQGTVAEANDSEEEPDDGNEDTQGTDAEANDSEEEPDDENEDTQGPNGEDNDSEEEPDDENEDTQGTDAEANDSEEEPDDGNEDTQGTVAEANDSEEEPDDGNEDTQGTDAEANDSEEEPDDGNEDTQGPDGEDNDSEEPDDGTENGTAGGEQGPEVDSDVGGEDTEVGGGGGNSGSGAITFVIAGKNEDDKKEENQGKEEEHEEEKKKEEESEDEKKEEEESEEEEESKEKEESEEEESEEEESEEKEESEEEEEEESEEEEEEDEEENAGDNNGRKYRSEPHLFEETTPSSKQLNEEETKNTPGQDDSGKKITTPVEHKRNKTGNTGVGITPSTTIKLHSLSMVTDIGETTSDKNHTPPRSSEDTDFMRYDDNRSDHEVSMPKKRVGALTKNGTGLKPTKEPGTFSGTPTEKSAELPMTSSRKTSKRDTVSRITTETAPSPVYGDRLTMGLPRKNPSKASPTTSEPEISDRTSKLKKSTHFTETHNDRGASNTTWPPIYLLPDRAGDPLKYSPRPNDVIGFRVMEGEDLEPASEASSKWSTTDHPPSTTEPSIPRDVTDGEPGEGPGYANSSTVRPTPNDAATVRAPGDVSDEKPKFVVEFDDGPGKKLNDSVINIRLNIYSDNDPESVYRFLTRLIPRSARHERSPEQSPPREYRVEPSLSFGNDKYKFLFPRGRDTKARGIAGAEKEVVPMVTPRVTRQTAARPSSGNTPFRRAGSAPAPFAQLTTKGHQRRFNERER